MARVPDEEVERLKRGISVQRLAEAMGVQFQKRGESLVGRCVFHDDKTPSLVVTPAKNLWHCLGACHAGGTVIDWVMKAEGVSFRHAVELLRAEVPLTQAPGPRKATVPKLVSPLAADADDKALLNQVAHYYHQTLKASPEALAYLEKRGVRSTQVIDTFKLGFANRTLGLRLPQTNRAAGEELRGKLQRLGVLRESGHEHLNGSLVVPLLDESGDVVGMYGRKVTPGLRPGTPLHMYLPGPHRAAFNSAALAGQRSVIVCEALIDALSFWCAGFRNVTAAYGVEGFTPHHIEAFKRHGVRDVMIAFDRDDAGDSAAELLAKRLQAEGFDSWRVQFPRGMDANDYACKVQPAAKSLGVALRQALWMGGTARTSRRPELVAAIDPATAVAPSTNPSLIAASVTATAANPATTTLASIEGGNSEISEVISKPLDEAQGAVAPRRAPQAPLAVVVTPPQISPSSTPASPKPAAWFDHGPETTCALCVEAHSAPNAVPPTVIVPSTPVQISPLVTSTPSAANIAAEAASPAPSLVPAMPKAPVVEAAVTDEEVVLHFGPRRYRVRGLGKALSAESLKLNILVSQGEVFHVDTLELYSARQRGAWVKQAADELRVPEDALKRDLGAVLLKLEELQEKQLKEKLAPRSSAPALTESERDAALELLKSPQLLQRILLDFERCGVVGEETNKLVGYLATVSRKLDEPLAVLIQSSSAAGKSSLMEAVLAFVPEEDKTKYSAMTGQSLFYMGDADLKHKVLAIVEEEGASRASYALKLLQSEGELTIASTGKDPSSGRLVTHEYRVEGPTQLFLTTTASELDEELLNRCVVLTVDEERGQTQAIHRLQREKQTLEGLLARRDRESVLKLHKDAQRLLRPLMVANPFARQLTFLDERTRTRRDFPKYLTLIRTIALLHQHQRPVKSVQHDGQVVEYVEVTLEDVGIANRLAAAVFGRTLDELAPQARRLLNSLHTQVSEECTRKNLTRADYRFSRKDVRAWTGWTDFQVRMHLEKLAALEYLLVHRGQRGQTFVYELLYDGKGTDGAPFLMGLADVEVLRQYDFNFEHRQPDSEGPSSIHRAPNEPTSRAPKTDAAAGDDRGFSSLAASGGENAHPGSTTKSSSYPQLEAVS